MAKFYGIIGYADTIETSPGVWKKQIVEKSYYGDVIRNSRQLQNGDKVNSDVTISNQISIISDPYAEENIYAMRYIKYKGAKWVITNVEVQYPRLILTVGGLFNE